MFKSLFLALTLGATAAGAGTPTEETVICPVGGQSFTITGTLSCTSFGRVLSMRTITSCDFVTRLPICPDNLLPMYRSFEDSEIPAITAFMETEAWAALRDVAGWQRAYALSQHLEDGAGHRILLTAFWDFPDAVTGDPSVLESFARETEAEVVRAQPADEPFVRTVLALAQAHGGQIEEATAQLALAEAALGEDAEYARSYVAAVRSCLADIGAPNCAPDANFEP